jgi:hypothetical protein
MIKFPDISTLFTVNLDSYLRTHGSAYAATGAFLFFICTDRMVTIEIVFFSGNNMTFWTKMDAKKAFLADFFINFNISLQNQTS